MKIIGQGTYDENKLYFNIDVINKGRRPIKIEKAAIRIFGKGSPFLLLNDSFTSHRPKVLTEKEPRTSFLAE